MSQLVYEIIADEGRFVQGIARAEASTSDMDEAMRRLTGDAFGLNKALQVIHAATGRYARGQDVLNGMGILTTRQIQAQIAVYDRLIRQHQADALVTRQLTEEKERFARSMGLVQRSAGGVAGRVGMLRSPLYSLSFLINDLQQATYGWNAVLRATSNNLDMLLVGLGMGTGLARWLPWISIALSAATTAMVLFGGESEEAFDKAGKAAETAGQRIAGALPEPLALRAFIQVQTQLQDLEAKLAKGEAVPADRLKGLREIFPELQKRAGAFLEDAELITKLHALGIDLTEKENEKKKETLSLIEQEKERTKELSRQMGELRGGGVDRLNVIRRQNQELQLQIKLLELGARIPMGLTRLDPMAPDRKGQKEAILNRPLGVPEELPGLGDATAREMERIRSSLKETEIAAFSFSAAFKGGVFDLSGAISGGLANSVMALASGTASFREVLGSFMMDLGQSLILQGMAGLAIKAFIKNPITAIAAGAALVAYGAYVRNSAQEKANAFTGGVGEARYLTGSNYPRSFGPPSDIPNGFGGVYPPGSGIDTTMQRVSSALERNTQVMERIERNGVQAGFDRENFRKASNESRRMAYLTGVGG